MQRKRTATDSINASVKLTKLAAGDYLFGAYRISRYEENEIGPVRILDWPRDEELWGIWRWAGSGVPDPDDPGAWRFVNGGYPRRRDALDAALTTQERQPIKVPPAKFIRDVLDGRRPGSSTGVDPAKHVERDGEESGNE